MANWSNLRLIVIGSRADVTLFRRAAGAFKGHIDTKKSTVFIPDMEFGEGGDLQADAVTVFRRDVPGGVVSLSGTKHGLRRSFQDGVF